MWLTIITCGPSRSWDITQLTWADRCASSDYMPVLDVQGQSVTSFVPNGSSCQWLIVTQVLSVIQCSMRNKKTNPPMQVWRGDAPDPEDPLRFEYNSLTCTVRNRNEYSLSRYKLCHFNLTMCPFYLVKVTLAWKQLTAYCSTLCWTHRSKLSQKVVQCSFISLFIRKFF